jgi:O-succinylbenzoic acid--CoA ligase
VTQDTVLPNWLAHRAAVMADRPALLAGEARWTFAALDQAARATAHTLLAAGAQPGERVGLLLRNSAEFAAVVHAAPLAGVALVPLNTRLAAPELAWQLADSGARLLVFDAHNAALAKSALELMVEPPHALDVATLEIQRPEVDDRASGQVGEWARGRVAATPSPPRSFAYSPARLNPTIDLSETFAIIYTSGTTGQPKGAMLSYGNFWWSAIGSALNLGTHADDRWLAAMPLFHVGGLSILVRAAIYGITAIVHQAFDPSAVNQAIDTEGVTIVSAVSAMLARMLDERGERPYPPALRCVLLGGGPAPLPLLEACAARGVPVAQTYGLTEATSQVATLPPADALRKLGSAGKPLLPTQLRVEREGAPTGPGEVGDILVRGPTVMRGYINRPDATARALADGWLHTGDLGYLDAEGYLYVASRRDDLIVSGGENVYPAEVEAALLAHPAVEEAAALGAPDERWGQVPVAFVKLRANTALSEDEAIAFCRARLAGYKAPKRVRFVDALPHNAGGKVLRNQLREML